MLAARLRELVDAGEAGRGEIVVLLRAFTHVDAYEEALERAGLDPTSSAAAATGPSSRSRTCSACSACVANPLDDEALLGALASPRAASARTRSGCCAGRADDGRGRHRRRAGTSGR